MNGPGAQGLILKLAFVMAVLLYAGVSVAVLGAPSMDAALIPEGPPGSILALVMPPVALGLLVAGAVLGRRTPPEREPEVGWARWGVLRFVVAAALVEAGAILALALAFVVRDARWAILGAVPAAVLIALLPHAAVTHEG
jgi:hypothetical protein